MAGAVMSMKIEGLEELRKRMRDLPDKLDQVLEETAREWGTYYYNATQEACPVDTGVLAESGELEVDEKRVTVRYTAPYAVPVEYGWRRDKPILPVRKKALAWESDRVQRLGAKKKAPGNRVIVKRVITPARFKGISFIRVPFQRAVEQVDSFLHQAYESIMEAD